MDLHDLFYKQRFLSIHPQCGLKGLRNCILRTILVLSLFYSIRVNKSLYFLPIVLENQFFCLSVLFVFSACSEFDVILINFSSFCIIIIYTMDSHVLTYHFSLKQFVRTDTRHKNVIAALNNKTCLSESVKETLPANTFF